MAAEDEVQPEVQPEVQSEAQTEVEVDADDKTPEEPVEEGIDFVTLGMFIIGEANPPDLLFRCSQMKMTSSISRPLRQ